MIDKSRYYEKVGRFVREKRAGLKLSQLQLSEEANVSPRAISAIENEKVISDKNISKLITYFNHTISLDAVIKPNQTEKQTDV